MTPEEKKDRWIHSHPHVKKCAEIIKHERELQVARNKRLAGSRTLFRAILNDKKFAQKDGSNKGWRQKMVQKEINF